MDPYTQDELRRLQAEIAALRRGQAWPQAYSLLALLVAVIALLLPMGCR